MRRSTRRFRPGLAVLLAALTAATAGVAGMRQQWIKYVAPDRSYSFHHPAGWQVTPSESVIQMANAATGEEMALFPWNAAPRATARAIAEEFMPVLRQHAADLVVSGWQDRGAAVACDISYTDEGKPQAGLMMAMAAGKQSVIWLFTAPRARFSHAHAATILQAVASSLVSGPGSRPPVDKGDEPAVGAPALSAAERARVDLDLRAYVFVLEFGLGGPFTIEQEQLILDAMWNGSMVATAEGRARLDGYPALVKSIMGLDQGRLEEVRSTIESGVRETLAETGDADPAMKMLRRHLDARGRALVRGNPPLTEMAAQSYAELYAFAEAAARNPDARLADLEKGEIPTIKRQLLRAWGGFSQTERTQVASVPGLWMVLRKVIEFGTTAERRRTARDLAGLVTPPEASAVERTEGRGSAASGIDGLLKHNSLMAIQQQTFNTYMWSRGFNYTATGRAW